MVRLTRVLVLLYIPARIAFISLISLSDFAMASEDMDLILKFSDAVTIPE